MKKVETKFESSVEIKGSFHEDFQEVAETFAQNFNKYAEIGSSVCVVIDGETTVASWEAWVGEIWPSITMALVASYPVMLDGFAIKELTEAASIVRGTVNSENKLNRI